MVAPIRSCNEETENAVEDRRIPHTQGAHVKIEDQSHVDYVFDQKGFDHHELVPESETLN